jgi:hypothetical protein
VGVKRGFLLVRENMHYRYKSMFSVLVRRVVWWLEADVSESVLPPSSGCKCVVKEMFPLYCCLPIQDGGCAPFETLVSKHFSTRRKNPEK